MNIIGLTIFLSFCLAGVFICCFLAETYRSRHRGTARDSLLPLDDSPPQFHEKPRD